MDTDRGFWYPRRNRRRGLTGHFPLWLWLFPPLWLVLIPIYAIWLLAEAALFVFVALPVNILRALQRLTS